MNILITGSPGIGKTTIIKKVLPLINMNAGGFFTEEIRGNAARTGFAVETLDGHKATLAHVNFKGPYRVGKYGVDVQSFETAAIPAIELAIKDRELIVIDEIGKMELFSERFKEVVIETLDSNKPVFGVILHSPFIKGGQRGIYTFINAIKSRNDVKTITITYENRNTIISKIVHQFKNLSE